MNIKLLFPALLAVCLCGVGCGGSMGDKIAESNAATAAQEQSALVEKQIREFLDKPTGDLTEADLEKITGLGFAGSEITDIGLKEVAECKNLTRLVLKFTNITDEGLKEVAKLKNLTRLDLINTRITDAGLKEIAKLEKLTELSLYRNRITKAQIDELQKAFPNCEISHNSKN